MLWIMEEKTYQIITGILTLILIVGGTTLYIQSIGEKTGCKIGWVDIGEGKYKCVTRREECI